jgi:hypothetical protein
MQAVVAVGTVQDGFVMVGPFADPQDGVEWAERMIKHESWSVCDLEEPDEEPIPVELAPTDATVERELE